jgi:molybdopterin converting factor subunit 1
MSDQGQVSVRFFATLRAKAGVDRHKLKVDDGITVAEFKTRLREDLPGLPESGSGMLVAIGKDYAFDEEAIPSGAEIAVFPPVSGG